MFIGKYNRSVILTYVGVAAAFAGIAFAVESMLAPAMIALAAAGICDLFDGVIARRCKRDKSEKEFGVQIDSLADVVGFLALPAVLGIRLADGIGIVKYPLLLGYILCGIIRLAWFNTSAASEGVRTHYDGLPVTYAALIIPVTYAVLGFFPEFFSEFIGALIWAAEYAVIAVLFILNVKIAKPRGVWYIIFGALAVGIIALILVRDVLC